MAANSDQASAVRLGNRVRELRLLLGTSVRHLADEAGFSPSFISQVENGHVSPSIASLERIAKVLGVTLSDLFPTDEDAPAVVRGSAREELTSEWSRAKIENLTKARTAAGVEAVLITLRGGGRSGKRSHGQATPQFGFVVSGAVRLTLGEDELQLEAGDAITVPAAAPHRWENRGIDAAEILLVSPLPQRQMGWDSPWRAVRDSGAAPRPE